MAPEDRSQATFAAFEAVSDRGFGENRSAQRASALGQLRVDLDAGRFVEIMGAAHAGQFGEGVATRGDEMRTFAWGFTTATSYRRCQSLAVVDGAPARSVLTIHADHLFYDDLVSDAPAVRFDAIAVADVTATATATSSAPS